ncbi:MAG: N-6 DNA methylase [Tepidiformaceae bacterium]
MPMTGDELAEVVRSLMRRPGHENTRTLVWKLLTDGLRIPNDEILHEQREVRGRSDALTGRTVFEFKRDLRKELQDAETQLEAYLAQREAVTGHHYVGIATDGATLIAYELSHSALRELSRHVPKRETPRALLGWLEGALAFHSDIEPTPEAVRLHLDRESVAYGVARRMLSELWTAVAALPDVQLKRDLWSRQLERVYGSKIESDELWFQHTYLTIVAKTMATAIAGLTLPKASDLLSGRAFEDAAIYGAVESDFFDWVLEAPGSEALVEDIARQVARFKLAAVRADVLKGLYESLIDPQQRHDLGEYYTPDWLAQRICTRVITDPLDQRVLDPACGSGTFLFHAARRYLDAADAQGIGTAEALAGCCNHVFGVDVHPVAAIIARVTYLLALGDRIRTEERSEIHVPVYLGDSLQWDTQGWLAEGEVMLQAADELLHFPKSIAGDPGLFDAVVDEMLRQSEVGSPPDGFRASIERRYGIGQDDASVLEKTYVALKRLHDGGRDHIWGYVARNLSRPAWLSSTGQRAHVLIGNPPWLSYRYMAPEMQARFRAECHARAIWEGGNVATHQDLSALFFAKSVELYLQAGGTIAFVMPYAALNRKQFEGFRTGQWFKARRSRPSERRALRVHQEARFTEAWTFDQGVQPLFPVPSCVLIASNREKGRLPKTVTAFSGRLPRRDATPAEAAALRQETRPWPQTPTMAGGSPYREVFRQGATMVPRMLTVVELAVAGGLGGNTKEPLVQSRRSVLEKAPWKSLPSLRNRVEATFLHPLLLGESVAPYRLLSPVPLAVVPWDGSRLLDAGSAQQAGWPRLAEWMGAAEPLWEMHRSQKNGIALREQLDFFGKLSRQFPIAALRVLYAASGTIPAAALIRDGQAVIEHKLYWALLRPNQRHTSCRPS